MTIWGNHSATQYPDLFHAEVAGKNAAELVDDQAWLRDDVHPDGWPSAARRSSRRAARPPPPRPRRAAIDHVYDWVQRHRRGRLDLGRRSSPTAPTASRRA